MQTKQNSIDTLLAGIGQAAKDREFDIRADLRTLRAQYGYTGRKAYMKLLDAMIAKYDSEDAQIQAALTAKARSGDLDAIRLYNENRATMGDGNEVVIQDDIG